MSSHKTENYKLHIWEAEDDFLREEFNENFALLDTSVRMVTGAYTGDGAAQRVIDLGLTPLAVLVFHSMSAFDDRKGLAMPGHPCRDIGSGHEIYLEVVEGVFRLTKAGGCDLNGHEYHYLALW